MIKKEISEIIKENEELKKDLEEHKIALNASTSWVNHFMARNQEKADEIAELKKRS